MSLEEVALLGTARRRLDEGGLPATLAPVLDEVPAAGDEAVRLLDVAALATLHRRAGLRARPARVVPPPAPPDAGRIVPPAAARRLAGMLAGQDRRFLPLWLRTAADRDLRPPAWTLPDLLDLALRSRDLRDPVLRATGPRGHWLAGQNPRWSRLVGTGPEALPADAWTTGNPEQRLAFLNAERAADPGAARERLAGTWDRERPVDRPRLLATLSTGLGGDDEPWLTQVLDRDRSADVLREATGLLLRLPGSSTAAKARRHARAVVRLDGELIRARPQEDPARAVGWAPIDTWIPDFGRTAADVVSRPIDEEAAEAIWQGWARAAIRERDPAWAGALLATLPAGTDTVTAVQLLTLAPEVAVAPLVGRVDASVAAVVPAPWPPDLVRAVVRWIADRADSWSEVREALELAVDRVPFENADAIRALGLPLPLQSPMRRRYAQAAASVAVRREILEELR